MTKVQKNIGLIFSMQGAEIFVSCEVIPPHTVEHRVGVGEPREFLFTGIWPDFIQKELDAFVEGVE